MAEKKMLSTVQNAYLRGRFIISSSPSRNGFSMTIQIADEFSDYLVNRDKYQGDGKYSAQDFRSRFLKELDDQSWWDNPETRVVISFKGVQTLGPSWANEAFAYFLRFATREQILQ